MGSVQSHHQNHCHQYEDTKHMTSDGLLIVREQVEKLFAIDTTMSLSSTSGEKTSLRNNNNHQNHSHPSHRNWNILRILGVGGGSDNDDIYFHDTSNGTTASSSCSNSPPVHHHYDHDRTSNNGDSFAPPPPTFPQLNSSSSMSMGNILLQQQHQQQQQQQQECNQRSTGLRKSQRRDFSNMMILTEGVTNSHNGNHNCSSTSEMQSTTHDYDLTSSRSNSTSPVKGRSLRIPIVKGRGRIHPTETASTTNTGIITASNVICSSSEIDQGSSSMVVDDEDEEVLYHNHLKQVHDLRTWEMYIRITEARKKKNLLPTAATSATTHPIATSNMITTTVATTHHPTMYYGQNQQQQSDYATQQQHVSENNNINSNSTYYYHNKIPCFPQEQQQQHCDTDMNDETNCRINHPGLYQNHDYPSSYLDHQATVSSLSCSFTDRHEMIFGDLDD